MAVRSSSRLAGWLTSDSRVRMIEVRIERRVWDVVMDNVCYSGNLQILADLLAQWTSLEHTLYALIKHKK